MLVWIALGSLALTPAARALDLQGHRGARGLAPEQLRDHRFRFVVTRRAEASGGDDETGALEGFCDCRSNRVRAVRDRDPARDIDAGGRERPPQLGAVRVQRGPEDQLRTNGHDFDVHWWLLKSLRYR